MLQRFIIDNELNLDDGRPVGIESDTGLSIIPSDLISAAEKARNDIIASAARIVVE